MLQVLDDWVHPSIGLGDCQAFGAAYAWLLQTHLDNRAMVALFFRGGEMRECVCSFVLLPWYMLDGDFIELGDGVADRVIIALEEGFFDFEFAFYLTDNQL